MAPGGAGEVGIGKDGGIEHPLNFTLRTRALYALTRGFSVIIPDTIGGRNLRGERSKPWYAGVFKELIAYAGSRSDAPVFLLRNLRQGTIAAMNAASSATYSVTSRRPCLRNRFFRAGAQRRDGL